GLLRLIPVAEHHALAAYQQLPIRSEVDLNTLQWLPDRPVFASIGMIDRARRSCLGQSVALKHNQTESHVELGNVRRQCGAARDKKPHSATHFFSYGRSYELVGDWI